MLVLCGVRRLRTNLTQIFTANALQNALEAKGVKNRLKQWVEGGVSGLSPRGRRYEKLHV